MAIKKLERVFRRESRRLEIEFEEAKDLAEGTSQEVSELKENAFRSFLSRYYPSTYKLVKGKIYDTFSNSPSKSIDCIVVNPEHPRLIDPYSKYKALFADGVDLAIEVKPDLTNKKELNRAILQCQSVKKKRRAKTAVLLSDKPSPRRPKELIQNSYLIPFFIFGDVGPKKPKTLINNITKIVNDLKIPLEEQPDGIFLMNKGVFNHIKYDYQYLYTLSVNPVKVGWYLEEWNDLSLLGLLVRLAYTIKAFATIQEPIIKRYIKQVSFFNLKKLT